LRRARRWEDAARVTSGIAADLTHLLTSIKDAADRLRDGSAHDDSVRDHVTGLTQSVARAMALSRQLVAFGRKEARDPQPFDLHGAVRGLEPVLRRLIDEHIELTLAPTSPLCTVEAALPAIEEAVVHLAVAAAGALPAGGQIEMTTTRREVDALEADTVEGLAPGVYGVLSIAASGWGLDADVAARDDVRKGLAAARRSTGQMGVSVTLASVPGASLTFTLFVPGSQSDADHSEELAPEVTVMPTDVASAPGTATVEM
jgi:signal transduction histidine kinase